MCLDIVRRNFDPPFAHEAVAYKVMRVVTQPNESQQLRGLFQGSFNMEPEKWYKAEQYPIVIDALFHTGYNSGFHCFVSKKDAIDLLECLRPSKTLAGTEPQFVLVKVRIKGVTCYGIEADLFWLKRDPKFDRDCKVVVCQQMKIVDVQSLS
jgi:hypothetical protein